MIGAKEKEQTSLLTNREVKSSAFTAYFGEAKQAAKLYDALVRVENRNLKQDVALDMVPEEIKPEDIDFTTLSGVLFMARKNDLAFTVRKKVLVITEHQASVNRNMPLRGAIYYGREIEKLIEPRALYRTGLIPLPTPEFYVFYNGKEPYPVEQTLKLSDAYLVKDGEPMLELKVKVININPSANHPILSACRPLYEYSWFIQSIRNHMEWGMERDQAIVLAMKDCEEEGIMTEFIREHGTEAFNMLFTEFNMEDALEVRYGEGVEKGIEKGIERGVEVYIRTSIRFGQTREHTMKSVIEEFTLDEAAAHLYVDKYWKK